MSRVRQELSIVQFQVENRQASASMDALRERAKKLNEDITATTASIEALGNVSPDDAGLKAFQKTLKGLQSDLRDVTRAQNELMKGVKAADKLWKAAATGTMESLSVKEIKAGQRGIQARMQNLQPSKENARELQAMRIAIEEGEIAMRKFEADAEHLLKVISEGGAVSSSVLSKTKNDLAGLLDVLPRGTEEYKRYDAQLQAIEKHISTLSQTEKRLAGEIVTVEDARKRAAAADADEARWREILAQQSKQQATADRERAEGALQIAKTNTAWIEQDIAKTKEQLAAQQQLVGSIEALEDAESQAFSKMLVADTALQKQREETNKFSDAAWEAAKKVGELKMKLEELDAQPVKPKGNATLEQLKQEAEAATANVEEAQKKLAEIQSRSFSESPRAKELQAEIDKLQELIDVGEKYRKQFSKMSDAAFEKGYMGKEGMADDERKSVYRAQDYLERAYRDRLKASVADVVPKDQEDYAEYQAAAKRVAGGIVQNAQENFRRAMFAEIQNGELTSTRMEEEIKHYRLMMEQAGREAQGQPGGLRDDPEYNRYKFMIAQMEKYIEVARQVEAERRKIAGSEPFIEAARTDVMNDKLGEGFVGQQANRMIAQGSSDSQAQRKEEERIATAELTEAQNKEREAVARLNEAQQQSTSIDQQKAELQQKLADAQQKLNEAKTAAEGPTKALKEAEEAYTEAQKKEQEATDALTKAKGNMNLGEEEDKLDALERKHDDLTESLQKQKQAEQELAQNAADTRQKEQEAAIELAQAQNQSEESLKKSVEVLEQQNKTLEAGSAEWMENEQAIGKLNKRIEELKQQSQELRGEVMSLADAQELADKAMEEQALTTKTGWAASTEELKRAEQTLADKVAKAKRGTAEEEAAYQKLERQLKAVRTELNAGSMSGKQMMDVLANPKNVTSVDTLKAAIGRARQELDALGRRIDQARMDGHTKEAEKLAEAYDDIAEGAKNADQRMKELQAQSKGTASAFDKAWSRLKTYVGLYVGAAVAMQKLTAAMGDLLELSDKMGEVRKTTGFTADEVGRLSNNLAKLDTRTTLTQLMELSSLAGSVGLKTQEQVQGFTEAADQLIVALPELGNESARTIIKIANATGDLEKNGGNVRETLEKVGSTIIALRANSASAAGPITDFVSRVGAVGAQAGISIDQIAALGSTIDALGGRVEMSATALSRMIPAIRNNSFAIANSIGVTEKYLKSLAPMEQMVLIFQKMRDNIQHIDISTEEGMNAMADNVEAMLGKNATMREVMKDLEQQGARAGIVFGLLSRNVDELQKQLGIASEAYRENTALANEFNNMNETAAAKWERLKNQFEEAFVGDSAQRFLGGIIDGLRKIVDLLTGNVTGAWHLLTAAIYAATAAWSVFKVNIGPAVWEALVIGLTKVKNAVVMLTTLKGWRSMRDSIVLLSMETKQYIALKWALVKAHTEEEKAAIRARLANNALSKSLNANVILAIVAAIWAAVVALKQWYEQAHMVEKFTRDALASATAEIDSTTKKVDKLFDSIDNARRAVGDAHLEVEKAEKAVREAKKALDEGRGSVEDLEKAENDLKIAHQQVTTANYEHKASIEQINKLYSPYLGYMLSEISTAAELANARELINAKLRETILLKQRESAYDRVEGEFGEKRDKERKNLYSEIDRYVKDVDKAARLRRDLNELAKKYAGTDEDFSSQKTKGGDELAKILKSYGMQMSSYANSYSQIKGAFTDLYKQEQKIAEARKLVDDSFNADLKAARVGTENTKGMQQELREQFKAMDEGDEGENNGLKALEKQYKDADEKNRKQRAADLLHQMDAAETLLNNAKNFYDLKDKKEAKSYKTLIDNGNKRLKGLRAQREQLLKEAGDAYKPVQGSNSGAGGAGGGGQFNNGSNSPTPYGTYNRVTDSYDKWDADALVTRRKEMLERVRALANGAEVQSVLSEDAKFISEATRKNIKDTKQAIEWYNTERLKIQDALHEKHLTNTGDWMDPTKQKARAKTIKDEWSAYLNELDAYYTERKTRIQEAATDEGITEAEMKNRTLANEMEWHQRRAELQKLYARKSGEVTEEEQQAIFDILSDRTGDTADFIQATIGKTVKFIYDIGKHSEAEMRDIFGKLDKGIERDYLKQQQAVTTQMKAIRDIIEKERPYDGITANLRENLVTMGILTADMTEERNRLMRENADTSDFNSRQAAEEVKRTAFLLGEAENAYSTTIEEVMRHMGEQGMQAWADAIRGDTQMQQALMAQLRTAYDEIQNAIKKEASLIKKQTDIWWADIAEGQTQSRRDGFEQALSRLGLAEDQVKRANSLIGAGQASERVADRLAIKQMQVRLAMQMTYYNRMRQIGEERIAQLKAEGRLEDAEHLRRSLNLAKTEELKKLEEQRVAIANQLEESQNRLYTELKSWADLLTSSLQSVFEATHAGDAEYYNELAKLNLTGNGGPGAGTYMVIDNEGTSDATAHYEYLDEREALERQHEIERENAQAEAWKKVMDDINMKMSETITDQLNAMLQNASIDANTDALGANTQALLGLTEAMGGGADMGIGADGIPNALRPPMEGESGSAVGGSPTDMNGYTAPWQQQPQGEQSNWQAPMAPPEVDTEAYTAPWAAFADASKQATQTTVANNKKIAASSQSMFAKMTMAANMYGIAYQAMSNDNLSTTQKFEMMALQAVGNYAIGALTTEMAAASAKAATDSPGVLGKLWKQLGWAAAPVFAVFTGLLGGLMGLASSKIGKAKSTIAQATGASSASAGRLSTGMLTYAEGNVNEFTDPSTLREGRQYNVDAADGRTYRARYMGRNPKTHLTNGPEFHLSGERGREMIIDAGTTRQITMNEGEIWHAIQTLSGGGRISALRRRGRGVAAFADGNVEDFIDGSVSSDSVAGMSGMSAEQMAAFQASLDRNSEIMERIAAEGIKGVFDVYGKGGLVDSYDSGKKTLNRYGQRY